MKKFLLLTILSSLGVLTFAQSPNLINYQAVARDLSGNPLVSTPVNITYEIRQSTPTGLVVYSETHSLTTNQFGLFTAQIGGGTPVSGTFAGINWSTGLYYLQVTVNGDVMPATQLLSVPYALHANTATSGTPGADGNDNLATVTTEAPGPNCAAGGNFIEFGVDDNNNGTLEAGEIDGSYYVCNGTAGVSNDTSATNEIQTISISNDTVFLSNGGFVKLPPALGDNWGSQVVVTSGTNISGDGTSGNPLVVIDNDTSSTNELELPMVGNNIGDVVKWNGSAWVNAPDSFIDGDNSPTNEIELPATANNNDVLTWNGSAWVALAPNTGSDNQNLINGGKLGNNQTVNIQNGSGITFSVADGDSSSTNEHNTGFAINGGNLEITDGGGTLQVPLSGLGDSDWTQGTGVLYNTTDNVGIGTTTPSSPLTINTLAGSEIEFVGANNADISAPSQLNFSSVGLTLFEASNYNFLTASLNRMSILNNGDVGIGTNTPGYGFYSAQSTGVNRKTLTLSALGASFVNDAPAVFELKGANTTVGSEIGVIDFINTSAGNINYNFARISAHSQNANPTYASLRFYTRQGAGLNEAMIINEFSQVGIGTSTPNSRLDVQGHITMRDGNEQVGYIPVSNANGMMTWTDPSTIATSNDGDWVVSGSDMYSGVTGNVGLGITTPENLMHLRNNTGEQFKIGHNNQPTAEWIYDVNASGHLNIINENFGTPITVMTMNNLGRIGVGTSSPGSQFEVNTNSIERAAQFISSFTSNSDKYGLYALASGGGTGENRGVQGEATGASTNKGVVGRAFGGTNNWAGFFELGNVYVQEDLRLGVTTAGGQNPKLYINTPAAGSNNTSIEILNAYNGASTTYGIYNRLTPGGTGGVHGIWNYITPSASSNSTVYGTRNLILNNGNGTRYGVLSSVNANGTGEAYGTFNVLNHDGSGAVYGFRLDATGSTTTGNLYGLYITGPLAMENYIAGNTGVGVINPVNRLDVEGAAVIGGIYSGSVTAPANGLLVAGNVGIGNTNPVQMLHIGSTTNDGMRIGSAEDLIDGGGNLLTSSSSFAPTTDNIRDLGTATLRWDDVYATNGTINTSDRRDKTNIQPLKYGIEDLLKLNPVSYQWKNNPENGVKLGLIAQDLQEIVPEVVKDWDYEYSEETGERKKIKNERLGVYYSDLIPVLIKSIQQQQKMIDELKEEIQDLKNQ